MCHSWRPQVCRTHNPCLLLPKFQVIFMRLSAENFFSLVIMRFIALVKRFIIGRRGRKKCLITCHFRVGEACHMHWMTIDWTSNIYFVFDRKTFQDKLHYPLSRSEEATFLPSYNNTQDKFGFQEFQKIVRKPIQTNENETKTNSVYLKSFLKMISTLDFKTLLKLILIPIKRKIFGPIPESFWEPFWIIADHTISVTYKPSLICHTNMFSTSYVTNARTIRTKFRRAQN